MGSVMFLASALERGDDEQDRLKNYTFFTFYE